MNKLIFGFLFLLPLSIYAETGKEVCDSITFSRVKEECNRFIQGRYFDRDAGYVCYRATFNDGKFDCVTVSADKEYTLNEANLCNDYSRDDERVNCMRSSGRQRDEDDLPSEKLRMIRTLSVTAIEKLYDGDIDGAITTLQRIKRLASSTK